MIPIREYWILLLVLISFSCKNVKEVITPYAPTSKEVYPTDTILQAIIDKKAMIVIAHDDDMCAMAGTISKLNKEGWEIEVVSFHKEEERDKAQIRACRNILDRVTFFDLDYSLWRIDLNNRDQNELYLPVAREKFDDTFNKKVVSDELTKRVNSFKPTVIFSLDNEIGGYGHPEHVFISQLVLDLAQSKTIAVTYIYQSVYTPDMTESIMSRHSKRMIEWGFAGDGWEKAKETYKVNGMPQPTTQVYIASEANEKMDYLKSYNEREQKTIGFFIPAFFEYSAGEYFKIFDREFFRVIKIN
ncbi:MAG: PIG-L family deacetylase [Bacteroidota bacterium]